jgi:hypothetical protein
MRQRCCITFPGINNNQFQEHPAMSKKINVAVVALGFGAEFILSLSGRKIVKRPVFTPARKQGPRS